MKMTDPDLKVIWATANPVHVVAMAARQTMKQMPDPQEYTGKGMPLEHLISFLYKADHRSPLEHAVMCIHLTGVSRACMAQITRHRLASYTCSSQHYQDYSDYPLIRQTYSKRSEAVIDEAIEAYKDSIANGQGKGEARMVLPEGMTVNMLITANAREWAQILHQRLCKRNTEETLRVARLIMRACQEWFPQLFAHVGPQCFEDRCKQGKLSCGHAMVQGKLA
jgi:thymidylate synthase (FAD)